MEVTKERFDDQLQITENNNVPLSKKQNSYLQLRQ